MNRPDDPGLIPTGSAALDTVVGGWTPGDNIVWVGDRPDVHAVLEDGFLRSEPAVSALVRLSDHADRSADHPGIKILDGRAGRPLAEPMVLEREILDHGSIRGARIVIDDLDTLVRRLGPDGAVAFFSRVCPRLFDRAAVAYWRASRTGAGRVLDGVQRVTQCVIDLTGGRFRMVKGEGRPGLIGRIYSIELDGGDVVLDELKALGRLADGLRQVRTSRDLTQTDVARMAGVTPSAISQVESGHRGLNLDTLLTLASALNVTLDDLVNYQVDPGYVLARRDRIPARRGVVPLIDNPDGGLRSHLVTLGGGESGEPNTIHKGAELVLVASGVIQVLLNTETPVLRAGDALLVTTDAIHGWRNLLSETARLFWIVRD